MECPPNLHLNYSTICILVSTLQSLLYNHCATQQRTGVHMGTVGYASVNRIAL